MFVLEPVIGLILVAKGSSKEMFTPNVIKLKLN